MFQWIKRREAVVLGVHDVWQTPAKLTRKIIVGTLFILFSSTAVWQSLIQKTKSAFSSKAHGYLRIKHRSVLY